MDRRERDPCTPLTGSVALIAGARSTIGAATARLLAAEGARVALTAPPSASALLNALATQIEDAGGQCLVIPADLGTGTRARARTLVRRVIETWGRLDILVVADGDDAAAGLPSDGASAPRRLGQPDPAVRGLLHATTAVLPPMTRQGGGDIVVVAPVAGRVLRSGSGGFASARVALEVAALCDTLRRQAGPRGVRVAVVEPDLVAGEGSTGRSASPAAEDVADAILYVLTQPSRLSIAEVLIRPTDRRG